MLRRILAASYFSDYDWRYLAVNAPNYVLVGIVPKIPEMHRVRLFGINRTAGIDDDTGASAESSPSRAAARRKAE